MFLYDDMKNESGMKENIYLSNQLEVLADYLKNNLFASLPFEKKRVILPSYAIKSYLSQRFAKDPDLNVCAGIQMNLLSEGLFEWLIPEEKRIPTFLELSLLIQREIELLIKEKEEEAESIFALLFPVKSEDQKGALRIAHFSGELAKLFLRYGIFGGEFLESWQKEKGWQQKIWRKIFGEDSFWTYPQKALPLKKEVDFPIHLIGFSFLPKLYFRFFKDLGSYFYLLSPCRLFWTDLYSDKQRIHFLKKIQNEQKEEMDIYLRSGNRLLANFGKMGKEFAFLLENEECITEDTYIESSGSFLKNLQNALLNLQSSTPLPDASLQLFAASSLLQEVELLLENLLHLMREDPSISPKDILVLAPDINEYLSYIHFIFPGKLDYKINQIQVKKMHSFAEGLHHLLHLPSNRFEAEAILKLLTFPSFVKKQAFTDSEISAIKKWTEQTNVQWGIDGQQRDFFLKRERIEKGEEGTWRHGLDLLLSRLSTVNEQREAIELTEAELLGKWAELIFSLNEDLQPILNNETKELFQWTEWIKVLAEKYFLIGEERSLFEELDRLSRRISVTLSFESFERTLLHLIGQKSASFQASHLQAVTFSSLTMGSIFPSKVIYLLGMQEEAFPRREEPLSFSALKDARGIDYHPTKGEEDRWLFLETLLSARSNLLMSYLKKDKRDGKKLEASPVIQELKINCSIALPPSKVEMSPPLFFHEFHSEMPLKSPLKKRELIIDIKHLQLLARHPIRFYFNRTLGIYLDAKRDESSSEFIR
jgi:exodeoxyribonuclease V gamma subunit